MRYSERRLCGLLAQWQSNGLLSRGFWVRVPGGSLQKQKAASLFSEAAFCFFSVNPLLHNGTLQIGPLCVIFRALYFAAFAHRDAPFELLRATHFYVVR